MPIRQRGRNSREFIRRSSIDWRSGAGCNTPTPKIYRNRCWPRWRKPSTAGKPIRHGQNFAPGCTGLLQNFIINALNRAAPRQGGRRISYFAKCSAIRRRDRKPIRISCDWKSVAKCSAGPPIKFDMNFDQQRGTRFGERAIENQPIEQVAAEFGLSSGAIYAARSRIMRRLKEKVSQFEEEGGE